MPDPTTRWWLVRHAPVAAGGRIYGQQDLPADTADDAAAAATAARLPPGARWLCTPLQRTRQTADAIAAHMDAPPRPAAERDLMEQHFGTWQGRAPQALMREDGESWRRFWDAPGERRPPGGESFADVVARVGDALDRHSRAQAGGDIVAVVHGGSVRAALATALGLAPGGALAFVVDTWSVTRIDRIPGAGAGDDPSWRIVTVNAQPVPGRELG
jgi:alpha-ribazole phosphatase